jgi:hypothetical protein
MFNYFKYQYIIMEIQFRSLVHKINLPSLIVIGLSFATPVIAQPSRSEVERGVRIYNCEVVNIESGQLALRVSPGGRPFAGLDNGDIVTLAGKSQRGRRWVQVTVDNASNSKLNNKSGYVNSNYLSCS